MSRRVDQILIDAQTASGTIGWLGGNKQSNVSACAQIAEIGIYTEFADGSAAGTVLIETASDPDYSGTWAIAATINWAADNKCTYTALTNSVRTLRARISSAVTTGTVSVRLVGNIT